MKRIGLTIGKYAPLHKGHQLLIETAIKEMDEVYCIIYDTDVIDFAGYHMNKKHWITIKLDGSVNINEIYELIDNSYNLSKNK